SATSTIASGMKIATVKKRFSIGVSMRRRPPSIVFVFGVQPFTQFLAGLEERHPLLLDLNGFPSARVASHPRRSVLYRKRAESTQLDAVACRQRLGDLVKDRVDDVFDVAQKKMRIAIGDALHQLGLDHRVAPPLTTFGY